ncbi:MAG: DUF1015 family protein [Faecalibacterium sp.]|nr:DUF1015 family protein [Ruminococcus sp.]MCM1393146.1 DUF1015 family protein [Ruminococcus sp.]MCM1485819.1 DUF1015 family protein [Faecalibacterium sp.]
MAVFKAFKAIRPTAENASKVAALPYDVMNSDEARDMVKDKPYSFLHVDKAEVDLDREVNIYDERVYLKARENLDKLITDGICEQEKKPCFYIYRQIMDGRSQTGLVGCAAIDDYMNNIIKKHEFTRADKEQDRINHVDYCDANTGPIFLAYRENDFISETISAWQNNHAPVYDFTTEDGIVNTVWVIDCDETNEALSKAFEKVDYLYIADGHHRCASAVKVGRKRREQNPDFDGTEEFNFFLAVVFPKNELAIMDYNRVIKDLNGLTNDEYLAKLSGKFTVEKADSDAPYKPKAKHTFGMYLDKQWYKLTAKEGTFDESDPVGRLDVSILQNNCITPIFDISDPRTDKRIDFVGGIRGLKELERRCETDMKVAFSMYPTSLDDLMAIADAGKVMPPKSTWFEPKLLSGLFVHKLG